MRKRVLSGIRPTGELHLGNYLGAIRQWIDLQHKYESFFMVADLHAITSDFEPKNLQKLIYELVAIYLAAGLDTKKAMIFVQSHIPQHTELAWLLSTLTSFGDLNRMTQFKEKSQKEQPHNVNAGLFNYPLLMTADIIIYKADLVPVGEDQVQHIELARAIVDRFNRLYGRFFPKPRPLLTKGARIMSLNNPNRKMAKSVSGSYISLLDSPAVIKQKIMSAVTDTKPGKKMSGGVKNLFTLLNIFAEPAMYESFKEKYQKGTIKYLELKKQLAEDIIRGLAPLQKNFIKLKNDQKYLKKVIGGGDQKARVIAAATLLEVKKKMGLI
ncbi:tryptophan--tRNA ligase [Candidatus Berkelbacteria bacterium]|nr:tryptophan--tRNA ligase [Candidatus Berkelbacteria bacterium]MBI4029703.1 tryptophan--tRNA ligase [Candidatus Berkelbacteria bacterium]